MELKLEEQSYQREAVDTVVRLIEGQTRNTFDMACSEGVRSNIFTLPSEYIHENVLAVIEGDGVDKEMASLDQTLDFCIEMETGTGKTLVYLKTIYELYRQYTFTKFIILVPSVAIKERVLSTFEVFKRQQALESRDDFRRGAASPNHGDDAPILQCGGSYSQPDPA